MILNKVDLLPYVPFKPELARDCAEHSPGNRNHSDVFDDRGRLRAMDRLAGSRAEKKKASSAIFAEAVHAV